MITKNNNWLQDPHMAEVKITYNSNGNLEDKPILNTPEDVYEYLLTIWDLDRIEFQESFFILLFNNAMRCIGWHKLSMGGKNATIVDVSHLLIVAALGNASSVIVAHNHPSGTMKASKSDIQLTRRIKKALGTVGIVLNDHLIISRRDYYSFNEQGLLNKMNNS